MFQKLNGVILAAADRAELARKEIVASYQQSLDAFQCGDADGAMQIDTSHWVSITVGQRPRTREEMEPFLGRDIASLKPPRGMGSYMES